MSKDAPNQLVGMILDELLWPDHPLGRDVAGTNKSVADMSRELMLDYMASEYSPANTVIAIAGTSSTMKRLMKCKRSWATGLTRKPAWILCLI